MKEVSKLPDLLQRDCALTRSAGFTTPLLSLSFSIPPACRGATTPTDDQSRTEGPFELSSWIFRGGGGFCPRVQTCAAIQSYLRHSQLLLVSKRLLFGNLLSLIHCHSWQRKHPYIPPVPAVVFVLSRLERPRRRRFQQAEHLRRHRKPCFRLPQQLRWQLLVAVWINVVGYPHGLHV